MVPGRSNPLLSIDFFEWSAEQHYLNIRPYCEALGINLALVTGTLKGKERKAIYQEIKEGKTHIIVGTHSLVQKEIQFKNLVFPERT